MDRCSTRMSRWVSPSCRKIDRHTFPLDSAWPLLGLHWLLPDSSSYTDAERRPRRRQCPPCSAQNGLATIGEWPGMGMSRADRAKATSNVIVFGNLRVPESDDDDWRPDRPTSTPCSRATKREPLPATGSSDPTCRGCVPSQSSWPSCTTPAYQASTGATSVSRCSSSSRGSSLPDCCCVSANGPGTRPSTASTADGYVASCRLRRWSSSWLSSLPT